MPLLEPVWDGELVHTDVLVRPAAAPDRPSAWDLIGFLSGTRTQTLLAQLGGYGPVRASALAGLSLELQQQLPGQADRPHRQLAFDGAWWRQHGDRAWRLFEHRYGRPRP